jgi:ADP-heptose:LPS heptosyltransferase
MHPFASAPDKAWPVSRFVAIAQALGSSRVAVLGGPEDDTGPFEDFNLFRNASLDTVKRLLRGAALFIGNDSGPAHMAAAFDVPAVVLFGSSNPAIWGPWKTECRILQSPAGLQSISVDACLNAVDEIKVRA